jgi:hypothetical protein
MRTITTTCLLALAMMASSAALAQDAKPGEPAAPAEPPKEPIVEQVHARPSIKEALADGVAFLVKGQNVDGSWGTGTETRGTEVYSMVPGSHDAFRVATTALCVMALREAGIDKPAKDAHDRGLQYLIRYGEARRDHGALMYNIWAHIYVVQALSIELPEHPADAERIKASILWHLDRMHRYETYVGGWNYYDFDAATQRPSMEPTSFSTAAGLVALKQAREAGVEVSQKMVDRAIRRLTEMRMPTGAYLYSGGHQYRPRGQANLLRGKHRADAVGELRAVDLGLAEGGGEGGPHRPRQLLQGAQLHRDGPQADLAARVVVRDGAVLLLFRALLRGPAAGKAGRGGAGVQGAVGGADHAVSGARRVVVRLPDVGLPQALRHRVRDHDVDAVPVISLARFDSVRRCRAAARFFPAEDQSAPLRGGGETAVKRTRSAARCGNAEPGWQLLRTTGAKGARADLNLIGALLTPGKN